MRKQKTLCLEYVTSSSKFENIRAETQSKIINCETLNNRVKYVNNN